MFKSILFEIKGKSILEKTITSLSTKGDKFIFRFMKKSSFSSRGNRNRRVRMDIPFFHVFTVTDHKVVEAPKAISSIAVNLTFMFKEIISKMIAKGKTFIHSGNFVFTPLINFSQTILDEIGILLDLNRSIILKGDLLVGRTIRPHISRNGKGFDFILYNDKTHFISNAE